MKTHRLDYTPHQYNCVEFPPSCKTPRCDCKARHHQWKQWELMSEVSPPSLVPACCSQQDRSLSNVRLHSMSREKSGVRAERAGQCLKLLLVHFKLISHPQIHSGVDVTAEGKWQLLPIPSVVFILDWAEGRQSPGDRLWGRKGTRMDGMLGESQSVSSAHSL